MGSNAIIPETKKIKLGEVEYVMSHRLLDVVVASELSLVADEHLKWCDIVVGGDHGQGAFHFPLKLILKYDNHPPVELEKWLGEVVCDKESYELFQKTMADPLQASMLNMFENKVVATGKDYDGRLLVNRKTRETQYAKAGIPDDEENFISVPFCIFMTGDLSFFALILGKASSATSCYLCNLPNSKWKPHGHEKGTAWTLDRLFQTNLRVTNRTKVVDGVKRRPLLTTLEVDRFLPPTMHIMLGIGNNLLDDCLKFLDALNGLENVPDNIRQARQKFYDLLAIEMDVKQEMEAWDHCWGPELVEQREATSAMSHYLKTLSRQDRILAKKDYDQMKETISQLVKDRKAIEKRMQQASQEVARGKKIMREAEGTVAVTSKWL